MSIFAPIYRPAKGQHTYLARQHLAERKRKRRADDSDGSDGDEDEQAGFKSSPTPEATPRTASTAFHHPVNRTDQYYVAGHSREAPLPPSPFPHASTKPTRPQKSVEEELASFNPPLYVLRAQSEDKTSASRKRRHVENLTVLLHTCMLRGDWQRASRAWGLLLRTEIGGRGIDVRQHGRWGVGAELLIRRNDKPAPPQARERTADVDEDDITIDEAPHVEADTPGFSHEGFKLAKQYYDRLILQYPHTPRTQHSVNALAFYPALFNIWICEVQDRSKRAQKTTAANSAPGYELDEALPIAKRMDDLLLSPPYDTSLPLLQLRGMVGLWVSDLHAGLAGTSSSDDEGSVRSFGDPAEVRQHRQMAAIERKRGLELLGRVRAAGGELPGSIGILLDVEDDVSF